MQKRKTIKTNSTTKNNNKNKKNETATWNMKNEKSNQKLNK